MPSATVIIPTHNRSAYLREAIDSVRRQTFSNWECLVVDDGSTDDTQQVVSEVAAQDPRIRYLYQERSGCPSRVRNSGLDAAQSPLLAFLDDDDIWYPDKLARQVAIFDAFPEVGLVFAKIRKYGLKHQIWPEDRLAARPSFADLLRGNFVPTSTAMVRRSILDEVGLFNENYLVVEDYDLWLRIARVTEMVALPQVLCDYRVHPGSCAIQNLARELQILENIYDYFERECNVPRELLAPGRRKMYFRRVRHSRGPGQMFFHLWKALTA